MDSEFDPYAAWLGIEDKQRPLTNYQLLGLAPFELQAEVIEDHAQQQHAKLIPFSKGEHALMAKRLAFEIESAKTCLLNPATRAAYDAALRGREGTASGGRPSTSDEVTRERIYAARPLTPPASSKTPAAVTAGAAARSSMKNRGGNDKRHPATGSPDQRVFDPYHKWLAIPANEQPPNYYRLLGVSLFESDPDVIANAADARMALVKTFQTGSHSAHSQRILNEISSAKLCLLTPRKKAEYDRQLRRRLSAVKSIASTAATSSPATDDSDCYELQQEVAVERRATPDNFPAIDDFKPISTSAKLRRKQSPDTLLVLGMLGATTVAVAVILPIYLSINRSENNSPTSKSRSTAERRSTDRSKERNPNPGANRKSYSSKSAQDKSTIGPRYSEIHPAIGSVPFRGRDNPDLGASSGSPPQKSAETNSSEATHLSRPDLIEKLKPSIVVIKTDSGLGSGFVIDDSGLIVTNYHVIEGARIASAKFSNGTVVKIAEYVAVDRGRDLAILRAKLKGNMKLKAIPIHSALPRQGENVIAIGSPRGLEGTVTEGIVSAIRTDFQPKVRGRDYDPGITWVQTTAAISPGNSGGPLVAMDGKVVGVNTIINIQPGSQNLNFAVSAIEVAKLVRDSEGKKPRKLSSLPRRSLSRPSPTPSRPSPGYSKEYVIIFPSGKTLNSETFTPNMKEVERYFEKMYKRYGDDAPIAFLEHANGSVFALACHDKGVLDGITIAFYENEDLMVYASYEKGRRHGILETWDAKGEKAYWCQCNRSHPGV